MAVRPPVLVGAVLLSWAASCGGGEHVGPRNVLLVSLDTLSAKHASLYGYALPTTPFLEELAGRGVVFERHMANSNNTLKSHASLFTGVFAPAHGAEDDELRGRRALAPEWTTLAERFRDGGWSTAGFATHGAWLTHEFGMDQGFEHFESGWRSAQENHRSLLEWLDRERPERAFVFLHDFDAHSDGSAEGALPYDAPPELVARFAGEKPADYDGSIQDRTGKTFWGSEALGILSNPWRELPPEHLRYVVGLYDAGIAALDARLRELFGELDRRGFLDDALVVVLSDHGEEFEEHGGMLHRQFYDEVMRVPLVVVPPPSLGLPVPRRVDAMTRMVDVGPTLLELAGLPPFPDAAGSPLVEVLRAGGAPPWRDLLFESLVLRGRDDSGRYKLNDNLAHPVFVDLTRDPAERHNAFADPQALAAARERIEAARARLREIAAESEARGVRVVAGERPQAELGADEARRLRSLGYAGEDEHEPQAPPGDAR